MDTIAYQRMNVMCNGGYVLDDPYGINHNSMDFDHNTKLDGAEAIKFFSLWYEQANFYNYTIDPNDRNAGKINVRHVIFVIRFLVILVN